MKFFDSIITSLITPFVWVFSWFCWRCGIVSYAILSAFDDSNSWASIWVPIYNNLMVSSVEAQDLVNGEGKFWPWEQPEEYDEDEE